MNNSAKNVFKYYIEYAKADSKLACIHDGRDFQKQSELFSELTNIFEDSFSTDNYVKIFQLYLNFIITYYNELKGIAGVSETPSLELIKKKRDQFFGDKNVQFAIEAIEYLKRDITIVEDKLYNANYVSTASRTIKTTIFQKNNAINNQKIRDAAIHYQHLYDTYDKYFTMVKYYNTSSKYKSCIRSNDTIISEFHQGITHLSRFVNSDHVLEIYRFDSHVIRAIFDTQKTIIASMLCYSKNIQYKNTNELLIGYLNVKNIEVPGRNMSNFHEVFTRYNMLIDKYMKEFGFKK
ncbi:MAG: hypothetical protein Q7R95_01955 [bacterium]|nr:hypothetical protein [bacterium]